ncbi:unnamed protein product [Orchesella dallaii]|uniref:C2H2-type domain-containing protein n=1 Tax=Orchesella dallaii TaxID=48710 RepID=A0ABP1SAB8_9HEXA
MDFQPQPVCFVCLGDTRNNNLFSSLHNHKQKTSTDFDQFQLYVKFLQFAKNHLKIPSTTLDPLLLITDNGGKIFCETCEKLVSHIIYNSYLELLQAQLRLSSKLGELGKLLQSCNNNSQKLERIESLKTNLRISKPDSHCLQKVHQLLTHKCKESCQEFQPQVLLTRNDNDQLPVPVSFNNIDSGQEKDEEERNISNAESQGDSPIKKFTVIILNKPDIKEENLSDRNDDEFSADDDDGQDREDSVPGSPINCLNDKDEEKDGTSENNSRTNGENEARCGVKVADDDGGSDYQCCFCWRSFDDARELQPHIKGLHAKASRVKSEGFVCEVKECGQHFPTHLELNTHLSTHSEAVKFCKVCGWGFIDENLLELHELVHVKPVKKVGMKIPKVFCPASKCTSGPGFASISKLQAHYNVHHGISFKLHKCPVSDCSFESAWYSAVAKHKRRRHSHMVGSQKPKADSDEKLKKSKLEDTQCVPCGKTFKTKPGISSHLARWHTTMECNICKEPFNGSVALSKHVNEAHPQQLEEGEKETKIIQKKFPCEKCEKLFATRRQLATHFRNCHSEKRYECKVCHEMFRSRTSLSSHRLKRHVVKSVLCPHSHCASRFVNEDTLRMHLVKMHPTNEPDIISGHECSTCHKRFLTLEKLKYHLSNNHVEKPQECQVCHKKFKTRRLLRRHATQIHDVNRKTSWLRKEKLVKECPHCPQPQRFENLRLLQYHICKCHPDAPENLKCSTCGIKMPGFRRKEMKMHQLTHLSKEERRVEGKVFECHVCGVELLSSNAHKKHVKNHEDEAKYFNLPIIL